jgi:hypothetical protein
MSASRYCGSIINDIRSDTQNANDVPSTGVQRGISSNDILRHLNYAQNTLERKITSTYPDVFQTTENITVVNGTDTYNLAGDLYLGLRLTSLRYSQTSQPRDSRELLPSREMDYFGGDGVPMGYIRANKSIKLVPRPNSGGLLTVIYQRSLDSMDLRRGLIGAVGLDGSGAVIAISLSATGLDAAAMVGSVLNDFVCISNEYGEPSLYNARVTAYDAALRVLTVAPTLPIVGAAAPSAGMYVTVGRFTRTHSELPGDVEEYMAESTSRRLKIRESSPSDWQALDKLCQDIARDIVTAYRIGDSTAPKAIPLAPYAVYLLGGVGRGR